MKNLIGLALITLSIVSCQKEIDTAELIGSWESTETDKDYVFEEDMTFHFIDSPTAGPYELSGTSLMMHYLQPGGDTLFTDTWRITKLNSSDLILGIEDSNGKLVSEEKFSRVN